MTLFYLCQLLLIRPCLIFLFITVLYKVFWFLSQNIMILTCLELTRRSPSYLPDMSREHILKICGGEDSISCLFYSFWLEHLPEIWQMCMNFLIRKKFNPTISLEQAHLLKGKPTSYWGVSGFIISWLGNHMIVILQVSEYTLILHETGGSRVQWWD